ncbi:hypothetical protein K438DRAFT_1760986 [Mycena galopus ATCC 62051]|nr:hypothetical protein K438DRAFT_1760986 [Mycena galopus ATCC 62051]
MEMECFGGKAREKNEWGEKKRRRERRNEENRKEWAGEYMYAGRKRSQAPEAGNRIDTSADAETIGRRKRNQAKATNEEAENIKVSREDESGVNAEEGTTSNKRRGAYMWTPHDDHENRKEGPSAKDRRWPNGDGTKNESRKHEEKTKRQGGNRKKSRKRMQHGLGSVGGVPAVHLVRRDPHRQNRLETAAKTNYDGYHSEFYGERHAAATHFLDKAQLSAVLLSTAQPSGPINPAGGHEIPPQDIKWRAHRLK